MRAVFFTATDREEEKTLEKVKYDLNQINNQKKRMHIVCVVETSNNQNNHYDTMPTNQTVEQSK